MTTLSGSYIQADLESNFRELRISNITLFFSYNTVVAFQDLRAQGGTGCGYVVSENAWGTTTGKHIGQIDGGTPEARKKRLPRPKFVSKLNALVESMNAS